jgi:hypothetical protein
MMTIKFWMPDLMIIMLWCSFGIPAAKAQRVILAKGGVTYATGVLSSGTILKNESESRNFIGGDLGLEFQLGKKWSYSGTFQYMTDMNKLSEQTVKQRVNELVTWFPNDFYQSSLLLNSRFRYYPKRNPLVSLEGFFIEFGFDVGQTTYMRYQMVQVGLTNVYQLATVAPISETNFLPALSLGGAIALNEKLSLEFSGGYKIGNVMSVFQLAVKLRQAL